MALEHGIDQYSLLWMASKAPKVSGVVKDLGQCKCFMVIKDVGSFFKVGRQVQKLFYW